MNSIGLRVRNVTEYSILLNDVSKIIAVNTCVLIAKNVFWMIGSIRTVVLSTIKQKIADMIKVETYAAKVNMTMEKVLGKWLSFVHNLHVRIP